MKLPIIAVAMIVLTETRNKMRSARKSLTTSSPTPDQFNASSSANEKKTFI
jgi:hypothetical protein